MFICDECVELCNEILDEEFFEGKEKADAFKANWTELKDAAFDDYIIVLNPEVDEDDDNSYYYEQFYGDGNKIVALTIKTMIDED